MTYRGKVATVYLLSLFLDLINMFISAVAFPDMSVSLHAPVAHLAWVSNGYIIGLTLVMPLSAWLTRRFGPRRLFLLSLTVFSLATIATAEANSLGELVSWRVLQGAGGGVLIPVGQALTWHFYPGKERTRISTLVMMVALLAPAVSPALGGLLVSQAGWHAVLVASLPVSLLTLGFAFCWLQQDERQSNQQLPAPDITAIVTSGGGLICLLLSLTLLSDADHLLSGLLWLMPAITLTVLFVRRNRRQANPLLALHLLSGSLLRFSMLVYICTPGFFIGVSIIAVFWLQQIAGLSAEQNGALMIAWSVAAFFAIHTSGRLFQRYGPAPLIITGCLIQAAGILWLAGVSHGTSPLVLSLCYALMGFGGSLCSSTAQNSAMQEIDSTELADASALWNINRQLSFCFGVALLSLLLSLLVQTVSLLMAYRVCFIVAACVTCIPALASRKLRFRPSTPDTH
ncbi:MFS transporter [Tatumella citrea]|uniref:MFS transporter n=1 Tax=Tatumella citrea TaxID=53336 RepID=A0A1Y0LQZ5_TATCI|nr:MFS transporter [Tatumella citrea]ARU95938.1 MFS transporter [Tatumella citrea]ARU99978.1 MFS transporter [Tatumella citrea]